MKYPAIIFGYLLLLGSCAKPSCDLEQLVPRSVKAPHGAVEKFEVRSGIFDPYRSVVFEPASPTPQKAPVILFLHGYFDGDPEPYEAMLRHFTRQGYIVIYPSYGDPMNPKDWAANAEESLVRALKELEKPGHVQPDRQHVAFVGHSIGATLAFHLAERNAVARPKKIPQPELIVAMEAAGISTIAYPSVSIDNLKRIPASTSVLLIVARDSYRKRLKDPHQCLGNEAKPDDPCNAFAVDRRIFINTPQIPYQRKKAVLVPSDHNGAQGYCGSKDKPVNAVDVYGYWKLTTDALSRTLRAAPVSYATSEGGRFPLIALDQCLQYGDCPE